MPHHTGNCSDCNAPVDTSRAGACLSQSSAATKFGSVYLLCVRCIASRDKRPTEQWKPGKHHRPEAIEVVP